LAKINEELTREEAEEKSAKALLEEDEKTTHSIFFHFKSEENQRLNLRKQKLRGT